MGLTGTAETGNRARFRDVFGLGEFRALWASQVLSVTGDQLARVALTVLVYDRTGSALLAAVAFAASIVPTFVGGVTLARLADRFPRRRVMIAADLASALLVAAMVLPGVPLAVLILLLVAVTLVGALFMAARAATYPEILDGDRYVLGSAVNMTTLLFAQVAGFAVGGMLVAFLGVRVSLLVDAATFAASALITRAWLRNRPLPAQQPASGSASGSAAGSAAGAPGGVLAGLRLVFGNPAMRTPMLFGWLCAFYELPQGVATPLATAARGGAVTVGLILASQALGSAVGVLGFGRLVGPDRRVAWTGPLAMAACASLLLFAARPGLAWVLVVLAVSGLFGCYQIAANASFVQATPPARRSQAFGIAQGGISLGQGTAIVLAGAAVRYVAPAWVIVVAGAVGTLCAAALTVATARAARAPVRSL